MITIFKIHNGGAPLYLNDIIPDKYEKESSYNTRNKRNNFIPRSRLDLFQKYFVPDSIRLRNLIKSEASGAVSINSISVEITSASFYFAFGKRFIKAKVQLEMEHFFQSF